MNYLIGNCYFIDRDLTFWQVFLYSFKNKSILNLNQVLNSNLYKTNKFSNALRFVDCAISGNGLFQKHFKEIFHEELRLKKEKVSSVKDSFLDTGLSQSSFICSKLTIEILQQDVKYVQN